MRPGLPIGKLENQAVELVGKVLTDQSPTLVRHCDP